MHIYLIGYRGSGKSTVGRILAKRLGVPIVDTDDMVEQTCGMSIKEIFQQGGEASFRDREEQAISDVASRASTPCVVALGGGAILRESNRIALAASGECVWLRGSAEQLFDRINRDESTASRRPALSHRGGYDEVAALLAAREPLYRQAAQKIVGTDDRTPDEVVAEILVWVRSQVE